MACWKQSNYIKDGDRTDGIFQKTYDMGDVIDHEYSFAGNYGAKGEKGQHG